MLSFAIAPNMPSGVTQSAVGVNVVFPLTFVLVFLIIKRSEKAFCSLGRDLYFVKRKKKN
jgi:hypothetical protein